MTESCSRVYFDIGSNIGNQVHKLYHPLACASAPVEPIFRRVFGTNRRDVSLIHLTLNV
jgi:hypothetical protein